VHTAKKMGAQVVAGVRKKQLEDARSSASLPWQLMDDEAMRSSIQ